MAEIRLLLLVPTSEKREPNWSGLDRVLRIGVIGIVGPAGVVGIVAAENVLAIGVEHAATGNETGDGETKNDASCRHDQLLHFTFPGDGRDSTTPVKARQR